MTDVITQIEDRWLNTRDAAGYLGMSAAHLKNLRLRGMGPKYARNPAIQNSPCMYKKSWLDEYMTRWAVTEPTTARNAAAAYERKKAS